MRVIEGVEVVSSGNGGVASLSKGFLDLMLQASSATLS